MSAAANAAASNFVNQTVHEFARASSSARGVNNDCVRRLDGVRPHRNFLDWPVREFAPSELGAERGVNNIAAANRVVRNLAQQLPHESHELQAPTGARSK